MIHFTEPLELISMGFETIAQNKKLIEKPRTGIEPSLSLIQSQFHGFFSLICELNQTRL